MSLERDDDEPGRDADTALPEGLANEDRIHRDLHFERARLQTVKRAQISLAAPLRLFLGLLSGQHVAPNERDEGRSGDEHGAADRGEVEQAKRRMAGRFECAADQEIRRCADQCRQASEQAAVGQRHKKSRYRQARASRNVDDYWQHERSDANVVHEGRQPARGEHDDDNHSALLAAGEP